jgi:hypothetical protein
MWRRRSINESWLRNELEEMAYLKIEGRFNRNGSEDERKKDNQAAAGVSGNGGV